MRYILRKFVEAETVAAAVAKDATTPVHDAYLKDGEEPKRGDGLTSAVGFSIPLDESRLDGEIVGSRKKS